MKKSIVIFCCLFFHCLFAQQGKSHFSLEADYFYGTILEHNPNIGHLITHHPEGFLLKYNRKTFGENLWEQLYNYPDWGFSFSYQNMKSPTLGALYGVYSHINWYFLKRYAKLTVGTGIAYATSPYHPDDNFLNNAYGSHLLSATYLAATFGKDNIWNGIGIRGGLTVVHYSNGNFKAPNTSTNTIALTVGLNYHFDNENHPEYIPLEIQEDFSEPIAFNVLLRFGINSSDVIGMGQFPFYILSAYADKRVSYKSTFSFGAEVFFSEFLKELIYYRSVAYPEDNLTGNEDYRRVGIFAGYALRLNKVAAFVNLGYYAYYPYDFEGRVYNRIGIQRFFGERERFFAIANVRAHAAKAETVEFGIGIRW